MRVFSVFFHPDPSISAVGGAEKRFLKTLRILARRKEFEITIIESQPSLLAGFEACCEKREVPSPISGARSGWLSIYVGWIMWTMRALATCLRTIRGQKYDVVFAPNNTVPNLIPAYFIHRVFHLPLCVIVHHIDIASPNTPLSFSTVYRTYVATGFGKSTSFFKALAFLLTLNVTKRCDACITVSNFMAGVLKNIGVPKERIYVSGNGVDMKYIDSFKREGRKFYDGVFVGRISKEKGVFQLVTAWRKIVDAQNDARLLVIGSGPDIDAVKLTVEELSLERNVVVKGPCTDRKMYNLMKASRVFIFPSVFEGWGLAVAEALACGLLVVCYDIPALREVFGKCVNVHFVPANNVPRLVQTVFEVLRMEQTSELAETSKTCVRRLDWMAVAMKDLKAIRSSFHH